MIQTRFTERIGVRYPLQCGTMMHISNAEFVGACANAGLFACLASAMFHDRRSLIDELNKLKGLTDKPFGVNVSLFPGHDFRSVDVTLDILAEQGVRIIETAGRNPEPHLAKIRAIPNVIHVHKCARLRDAVKADRLGVDIIAVVGAECGGHPGMEDISTLILIPEVARNIKAPLIAGGGFCDGQGLMAALSLGAEAAIMGTRFLTSRECRIHEDIKTALNAAELNDTMVIQKSIGSPVRVLINEWALKVLEMENKGAELKELLPFLSGQLSGKAWLDGGSNAIFPCGQVIGRVRETRSISEIADRIMHEAEATFTRLTSLHA